MDNLNLLIPAFIAGVLTFLAPCTLPLVPAYLGFISGVSLKDLEDPTKTALAKRKIFLNGVLFILGFSVVFIILGSLVGLGGSLFAQYRIWLARIGGVLVILFGLFMLNILRLSFLSFLYSEKQLSFIRVLQPGKPVNSFLFGATFAFGWTPCVGPVLGSILALAASSTTVYSGAFLLAVFSLGLAVPFLFIAATISSTSAYLNGATKYLKIISVIGGIFLIVLGILLLTDNLGTWIGLFYKVFKFINYDRLLNYL